MSFPLVIAAFGCTAILSTVATPYGCFFCTTVRHERLPVRVLIPSVSDVGRSPVIAPSLPAAAGASDVARSGHPTPRQCRVRLWITLWSQHCIDCSVHWPHCAPCRRAVLVPRCFIVVPAHVAPRPRWALHALLVGARSGPAVTPLPRPRGVRATASWTHQKKRSPGCDQLPGSHQASSRSVAESSGASARKTCLLRRPFLGSRREPDDAAAGTGVLAFSLPAGAYTPSRLFHPLSLRAPRRLGDATCTACAAVLHRHLTRLSPPGAPALLWGLAGGLRRGPWT